MTQMAKRAVFPSDRLLEAHSPRSGSSVAGDRQAVPPDHHKVTHTPLAIAIYFKEIFYFAQNTRLPPASVTKQWWEPNLEREQAFSCSAEVYSGMQCSAECCQLFTSVLWNARLPPSAEASGTHTENINMKSYQKPLRKTESRVMHRYYLPSPCRVAGHHLPWRSPEMLPLFPAYLHH